MAASWTEVLVFIDGAEYDCRGIWNTHPDRIEAAIEEFKQEFADDLERTEIRTRQHAHTMDVRCDTVTPMCGGKDVTVWNNGGHLKGCAPGNLCEPCGQRLLDASEADYIRVCNEVIASSDKFAALAELNR